MTSKRLNTPKMDEVTTALQEYDANMGIDALNDEQDIVNDEIDKILVEDDPATLEIHTKDTCQNEENRSVRSKSTERREFHPRHTEVSSRDNHYKVRLEEMREALKSSTPVEIFEELMTPEIYDHIVKATVKYAKGCKNSVDFTTNSCELKAFIGILLLSSYCGLPSEQCYWSNEDDLGVSIVKNTMSRNRFQMLKSFLYFSDNSEAENNLHDKGVKIRPLYTMLQKSYMKFGIFDENLSIDDMIIPYLGQLSLKQYISNKPIQYACKLWVLCGASGYCYNLDLDCGKSVKNEENNDLSLGSKVVLKMLSAVEHPLSYTVFFDNLFKDYPLLVHLRNLGFQTGEKEFVPRPNVLLKLLSNNYNQNSEGVDKHEYLIAKYPISIQGKTLRWRLFTHILDMTMVNAWIVYKFVHANDKEIMSLLDFRRQVCVAYMKGADLNRETGRKPKLHLKLQTKRTKRTLLAEAQ